MSNQDTLAKASDELLDQYDEVVSGAACSSGIRIAPESIRVCLGNGVRLVSAVSADLAKTTFASRDDQPVLGLFHASGRLGGDIPKPGIYIVRVVRDGGKRLAALSDADGNEVARVPLEIRLEEEVTPQATGGCCSQPEIGEGYACVGFTCCNSVGGCLSHKACITI